MNASAFPCGDVNLGGGDGGMTLRDYFAAKVIGHLVCAPIRSECSTEQDASYAYKVADAMLLAREANQIEAMPPVTPKTDPDYEHSETALREMK